MTAPAQQPRPDAWIDKVLVARVKIRGQGYTFYSDGARRLFVRKAEGA